jgi:DNA-binding transcriptional LysR family regulator
MHRRHVAKNVPMELLRALVTVVDAGGYTAAAEALNLTQSAVSAQIARLARLLGGKLFVNGLKPTNRGVVALQYARRVIAMNDELLATAGPSSAPRQLVIGLPAWMHYSQLVACFTRCSIALAERQVRFRCDRVERLVADLNAGTIDLAYLCNTIDPSCVPVVQWMEEMCWVKSPNLVLAPGASVPLVSWPGTNPDRVAVARLQECGMPFYVSFSAPENTARLAAVAAGLGVMPIPVRSLTPEVEVVRGGLPALPEIEEGIFARDGLDLRPLASLLHALAETLAPRRLVDGVSIVASIGELSPQSQLVTAPLAAVDGKNSF